MTELLSIKQLSENLGKSEKTIRRWVSDRKIPHYRMPGNTIRFSKDKIENWLGTREVKNRKTYAELK
jgi:PTS system nitrogen regulatory IIA component